MGNPLFLFDTDKGQTEVSCTDLQAAWLLRTQWATVITYASPRTKEQEVIPPPTSGHRWSPALGCFQRESEEDFPLEF